MDKYIINYKTKDGKKGIAIVSAETGSQAFTILKGQGLFSQTDTYILEQSEIIDLHSCELRVLSEVAIEKE